MASTPSVVGELPVELTCIKKKLLGTYVVTLKKVKTWFHIFFIIVRRTDLILAQNVHIEAENIHDLDKKCKLRSTMYMCMFIRTIYIYI